jgi:ferrous iron transport protein B
LSNSKLNIALVGNPNCGKTSLFNVLTGLNQKVGNFPGVTVDQKVGKLHLPNGTTASVIDLPGTYSLSPQSPDEQVVQDILLNPSHKNYPDVLVIVLDATNIKRNLFLATQVLELGIKSIVALNVIDLAEKEGIHIDDKALATLLKCDVIKISAKKGLGIDELKTLLSKDISVPSFNTNTLTVEQKQFIQDNAPENALEISQIKIQEISNRYKIVGDIFKQCVSYTHQSKTSEFTNKVDRILTHKVWGVLIFLLVFFLIFQSVFSLASYPMDLIDSGIGEMNEWLKTKFPKSMLSSFLIDGVIAGLGGVLVFIPQIMILFGLINILEETGYMARVSFINDRILRSVGMNGRSVVPLVGGFACAVPSIMATRTIENLKERLITILITPMMSCSARLPVYVFLIAFIVPDEYLVWIYQLTRIIYAGLVFIRYCRKCFSGFCVKQNH